MNTDSFEGWLSSKLFDAETAALVAVIAAIIIKQIGYVSTLFSTATAMYYSLRGGYRVLTKWKANRLERAIKREADYIQKIAHVAAAEVARLTTQQNSTPCNDASRLGGSRKEPLQEHWAASVAREYDTAKS